MFKGLQNLPVWRRANFERILNRSHRRSFSDSRALRQWRNETPAGGLTEIYVYTPESSTIWPDPTLGLFAPTDPRFNFPGHVGIPEDTLNKESDSKTDAVKEAQEKTSRLKVDDILEAKTREEHQAQTLHTAHDFIHYTSGSESYVCSDPVCLEVFPCGLDDGLMDSLKFELHEAPTLLRKDAARLFPGVSALADPAGPLSVITMSTKTENDMSTWSEAVEDERDRLTASFVHLAKEVCGRLKTDGYWSDFIDPSSGIPYFGKHSNTTMFETDEKYRLLGFRIEDLGCCKVIWHRDFGRNVFVGTIFTVARLSTGVVQDIFSDMRVKNLSTFAGNNAEGNIQTDANNSFIV